MRNFITVILLTLSVSVLAADFVYKRVNPDGTVEYSDKPLEGGNVMKVPKGSTFTASPGQSKASDQNTSSNEPEEINYKVSIASPTDDQAIRSNNGNINFRASLEPNSFPEGYRLKWTMDGEEIPGASSLIVMMSNVDRGTHEIQVSLIDAKANVVVSSEVVSFHLLRAAGG